MRWEYTAWNGYFVLETPHRNTECQLQGCHDSSPVLLLLLLNAFCRKYLKKTKTKTKTSKAGVPTFPNGGFLYSGLWSAWERQNISKPVADRKKKKKGERERKQSDGKKAFHAAEFVVKVWSVCISVPPPPCLCCQIKCVWVPIAGVGLRNGSERTNLTMRFKKNSIVRFVEQKTVLLYSGFYTK